MLGLQDYDSEEEGQENESTEPDVNRTKDGAPSHTTANDATKEPDAATQERRQSATHNGQAIGPAPRPAPATRDSTTDASFSAQDEELSSAAQSPCTSNRQLLHSLTLPPFPSAAIPPSPPGSPPPGANDKIQHFLDLKSNGVHFNAKLASSSALRNPSLLQNLMAFASIDEKTEQYATTLPTECRPVPPQGFPKHAYAGELEKTQQELERRRATKRKEGEGIEFVSAGSERESTGAAASRGARSTAERVMAGLDRERSRSPQVHGSGDAKKRDDGHKKSKLDHRRRD